MDLVDFTQLRCFAMTLYDVVGVLNRDFLSCLMNC